MVIYKVTNIITNKCYIGKTIQDFDKYKKVHLRSAKNEYDIKNGYIRPFYKSIRKYGEDNFIWEILCECSNKEELNEKEKYYISFYDTYNNGYNATLGGDGGGDINGKYERTDEIKNKISLSLIGHKRTDESKMKQSKTISGENHFLYGKKHKKESIEKMRKSKEGLKNPNGKRYIFISPNGIEYIVDGKFNDFCIEHHLWHNAMTKVHRGLKESHKGWKCFIIERDVNS